MRVRDAPGVSWGYHQSLRPRTYPFGPNVPRFWYRLVIEVPLPVPVEVTIPELPRNLQKYWVRQLQLSRVEKSVRSLRGYKWYDVLICKFDI